MKTITLIVLVAMIASCTQEKSKQSENENVQFELLDNKDIGIDFENKLEFSQDFNIYTYRNFYNGGGVAIGDINNDGLPDVYMVSNMHENKLYLNKGDMKFVDISDSADIKGSKQWSTGVSMVDINSDGWLDIYVCNSGDVSGDDKANELFINQKNGKFKEQAAKYGLADKGYGTHASFFDYDKDGDLDVYILNNSFQAIGSFNLTDNQRYKRDEKGGDKLMRNDNGKFVDISQSAGINGSVIGFGLGVTVSDIDGDGWQDIYVSNDFFEMDYLYINQKNGTFKEELQKRIGSISAASMGADIKDINNDLSPDIFATDMLPSDIERIKTKTTFDNWDKYQLYVKNGYHHQFTRNALQVNRGDGSFDELGRMANVEASDWSWGALMVDLDNDSWKDIYIANGIYQDLTDQDYLNFLSSDSTKTEMTKTGKVDFKKLVDFIPSNPIPNQLYKNFGELRFKEVAKDWGIGQNSFSNGAAYGDLDLDGDLDLVVNNTNSPCFVYRNLNPKSNNYLRVKLNGKKQGNINSFGTKVSVKSGNIWQVIEQMPITGFESTMENILHFGIDTNEVVDSIIIDWYYGTRTVLTQVDANQILNINEGGEKQMNSLLLTDQQLFVKGNPPFSFLHRENEYNDFDKENLKTHFTSNSGPCLEYADINGDGVLDYFVGGAKGQSSQLYLSKDEKYENSINRVELEIHASSEDVSANFFDADGDGDLDMFVGTGGSEFSTESLELKDRIYFNDGKGKMTYNRAAIISPFNGINSKSKTDDIDNDGDIDIVIAHGVHTQAYGIPAKLIILENNGKGTFNTTCEKWSDEFAEVGMITDFVMKDFDSDGKKDILTVGEWQSPQLFVNIGKKFVNKSDIFGLKDYYGLYHAIHAADLNGDGKLDVILGNMGLNLRLKTSQDKQLGLLVNDFDQNSTVEQILFCNEKDRMCPMVLRHDLVHQIPTLKKKILKYADYKNVFLTDLFDSKAIDNSIKLKITTFESFILLNKNGKFEKHTLPRNAQTTPIYAIETMDIDGDGQLDIIMGGNQSGAKPEIGNNIFIRPIVLMNRAKGKKFSYVKDSGLEIKGEIRNLFFNKINNTLLIAQNNGPLLAYVLKENKK